MRISGYSCEARVAGEEEVRRGVADQSNGRGLRYKYGIRK